MMVTKPGKHFIPLTQKELDNCLNLGLHDQQSELICLHISPIMSTKSDDCTVNLLTKDHNSRNCDRRVSNITAEIYIRLQIPNSWIAVFPSTQVLYVKCDNAPTFEKQLSGTGIMTLADDCQIKTSNVLIQAQKSYYSKIYFKYQPIIDYGFEFNESMRQLRHSIESDIKKFDYPGVVSLGESDKLTKLSTGINELRDLSEKRKRTVIYRPINHETDYWTLSFFIFLIISSYVILLTGLQYYNLTKNKLGIEQVQAISLSSHLDNKEPEPTETQV